MSFLNKLIHGEEEKSEAEKYMEQRRKAYNAASIRSSVQNTIYNNNYGNNTYRNQESESDYEQRRNQREVEELNEQVAAFKNKLYMTKE